MSRSVMLPAVPRSVDAVPDLAARGEFVADWASEKVEFGNATWQFESSLVVEWQLDSEQDLLNSKRHLKAKEKATSMAE